MTAYEPQLQTRLACCHTLPQFNSFLKLHCTSDKAATAIATLITHDYTLTHTFITYCLHHRLKTPQQLYQVLEWIKPCCHPLSAPLATLLMMAVRKLLMRMNPTDSQELISNLHTFKQTQYKELSVVILVILSCAKFTHIDTRIDSYIDTCSTLELDSSTLVEEEEMLLMDLVCYAEMGQEERQSLIEVYLHLLAHVALPIHRRMLKWLAAYLCTHNHKHYLCHHPSHKYDRRYPAFILHFPSMPHQYQPYTDHYQQCQLLRHYLLTYKHRHTAFSLTQLLSMLAGLSRMWTDSSLISRVVGNIRQYWVCPSHVAALIECLLAAPGVAEVCIDLLRSVMRVELVEEVGAQLVAQCENKEKAAKLGERILGKSNGLLLQKLHQFILGEPPIL